MPENPKLATELLPAQKLVEPFVYADKLVVLGNDFLRVLVVNHKVFHIVQQLFFGTQALQKALGTGALLANLIAAYFFFLVFRAQPMEKVFPLGAQAAQARFQAVAEHTKHIGEEQLGNIGLVIGQIVIVGTTQLDVGVLQLDKHQRQAVDIQQNIRPPIARLGRRAGALNP